MHSLVSFLRLVLRRFLTIKNWFTRRSRQLWSALWALVWRRFSSPRPPSGGLEQTATVDPKSTGSDSSPATTERHTATICASNVPHSHFPVSSSHPNLPSLPSRPLPSNTQRPISFVYPASHRPASDPYLTVDAPVSHLGIHASSSAAQSADNVSLASSRFSIIQAEAKRTSRGLSKPPSGLSSRAPQRFFTGDRAPPSSPPPRSSPASSRVPSRAPSRAPSRNGSPRSISSLRPSSVAIPDSDHERRPPTSDEDFDSVRVESPSEPSLSEPSSHAVGPGSEHQTPSVAGSRRSSVTDVRAGRPSRSSSTLRSSAELSFPEPPEGRIRKPIATCHILRYERDYKVPTEGTIDTIPALTTDWPHSSDGDCGRWTARTHPEGAIYFYDDKRHIFTDTYMYDLALRNEVEEFVAHLRALGSANSKPLPQNHELVLEVVSDGDVIIWGYYYVDHDTQSVFWLEDYPSENLTYEVEGVGSLAHVKHAIDSQYWMHWSYFPIGPFSFTKQTCRELLGVLIHTTTDSLTSNNSTTLFDPEKLFQMIALVKKSDIDGPAYAYVVFSVARMMSFFCQWRFINHHGQRGARLTRDKSIHGKEHRRTALITLLSPVLFWAPETHLRELEKLWVDDILNHTMWKNFVSKLNTEWTEYVAYASLLLTTNVAFLAIPAVTPQDGTPAVSPAQISSNMSVASSVGTIILGLLLMRQNRSKNRANAAEAATFLYRSSQSRMGFEPLAIIHSLPYALLMWATVTLVVALAIFCFWDTHLRTRIPVGAMSLAVLLLISWCILSARHTAGQDSEPWFTEISESLARGKERLQGLGERLRHRDDKHVSTGMELSGRLTASLAGSTVRSFVREGSVHHTV